MYCSKRYSTRGHLNARRYFKSKKFKLFDSNLFFGYLSGMIRRDTLWKALIEDLIEDFLHFFFPAYINQIDLERGVTFLDKDLEQIMPEAETKRSTKWFATSEQDTFQRLCRYQVGLLWQTTLSSV
jgi:hypothetical protein